MIHQLLLIAAVACFVAQALAWGTPRFHPAWWALGVAFYLAAGLA